MRPDDIMEEMREYKSILQDKDDSVRELAERKADTQMAYRIAVASEVARLRLEGETATLSELLAKGDFDVAQKKREAVVAEEVMKSCFESMKNARANMDLLRSLLAYESKERFSRDV